MIRNILCFPSGPDAGRISGVLDFDAAAILPLYHAVLYPTWFLCVSIQERELFEREFPEALRARRVDEALIALLEDPTGRAAFTFLATSHWATTAKFAKEFLMKCPDT
jgi:hypothetical protein